LYLFFEYRRSMIFEICSAAILNFNAWQHFYQVVLSLTFKTNELTWQYTKITNDEIVDNSKWIVKELSKMLKISLFGAFSFGYRKWRTQTENTCFFNFSTINLNWPSFCFYCLLWNELINLTRNALHKNSFQVLVLQIISFC
jgi:hypothetical protein